MKNIFKSLFVLGLLTFNFSCDEVEYQIPMPTLEFTGVEVDTVNERGLSKENLMKELKCPPILLAGRKYEGRDYVTNQDLLMEVVSFKVFIEEYAPGTAALPDDAYDDECFDENGYIIPCPEDDTEEENDVTNNRPVTVEGNSIGDSSIAKNLLDKAKVGDFVRFYDVRVKGVTDASFVRTIKEIETFKIIE